jgi:hypothetical protein
MMAKLKEKRKIYEVKFIPKSETENIFLKLDLNISEGYNCSVCGDKITKNNIGIFVEKLGKKIFVCNKPRCLKLNKIIDRY